jgi:hypothetical protein
MLVAVSATSLLCRDRLVLKVFEFHYSESSVLPVSGAGPAASSRAPEQYEVMAESAVPQQGLAEDVTLNITTDSDITPSPL